MDHFLDELNKLQKAAATATEGPIMIIAGAGSGKTRVLTYRIAHIMEKGVDAFNIHELLIAMNKRVDHFYDAKAAIEMACTDLICGKLDIPVYTYLGGQVVDTLLFNSCSDI